MQIPKHFEQHSIHSIHNHMFHSALAQYLPNYFLYRKKNEHSVWFHFFSLTCWTVKIHLAWIKNNTFLIKNSHQNNKTSAWWQASTCFLEWKEKEYQHKGVKSTELNECIVTWLNSDCTKCSTNICWDKNH